MDIETLKVEVSELAFGYLKAGRMSRDWLGNQLAPKDLPERFHHYDRLVDLHVSLHPQIASFAQGLQPMLRGIKTETRREKNRSRQAIEGHIHWPLTYQQRNNEAPGDRSLFVTERRTEAYDIPENLVLKKLLAIVHNTVSGLEDVEYHWLEERWPKEYTETNKLEEFKSLYRRNVHLNRITTPTGRMPTDRMIQQTKTSRQTMYKRAGQYLEWRRALLEGNQKALHAIFDSTIIEPDEDRLFELFAVLCLLKSVEDRFNEKSQIKPITLGANELAELGDPPCYIYHDSSAAHRGLRFPLRMPKSTDRNHREHRNLRTNKEWIARSEAIGYWMESIRAQISGSDSEGAGRPDALVFQPASKDSTRFAEAILAIEVKYSANSKKVDEGIIELLRYIAYATEGTSDRKFAFPESESGDAFGRHIHGLLVIDDYDGREKLEIDGPISIVQASNLRQRLPEMLDDVFKSFDSKR